jgi:hypothetical protein
MLRCKYMQQTTKVIQDNVEPQKRQGNIVRVSQVTPLSCGLLSD